MKKSIFRIVSLLSSLSLLAGVGLFAHFDAPAKEADAIGSYSTNASTYYSGISATGGKQLAAQLHDLITSTHQYYASYDDSGRNLFQQHTDQYYENGTAVSGYIHEFYSGVKWPNGWNAIAGNTSGGYNREHCWCQNKSKNADGKQMWGETGGGADMHHIRPVESRLNSTRSNHEYGEIANRDSHKAYAKFGTNATYAHGGYDNGVTFEPLDTKKGDVARIILYTYLHYNSYTISDIFGNYGTTNGGGSNSYFSTSLLSLTKITNNSTEADALEMLLSWNASDPVDEIEQRRNEQVAIYQGNRNPFIDNSNFAELIWGTGTVTPTVASVSVSPASLELDVNGTSEGQLTATVNVTGGLSQDVIWASSNENVATVSSTGLVTAVAKGSCSITATSVANPSKSASCSVKVVNTSGGSTIENGTFAWDLSKQTYETPASEELVVWNSDFATMESIRANDKTTKANNYLGGTYSSSRLYKNNSFVITPKDGVQITSVIFVATSTNYATAFGNSTWTNATASVDGTTVTITPANGTAAFSAVIGGTCGFTSATLNYQISSAATDSPLSSITLNISNVQTEFAIGDTFDYSGLVVTAHFEDGTEDFVDPTSVSSPDMTTAGTKEITVSYTENSVTKTAKYNITVVEPQATEIVASVTKTYHPGETIAKSDIHVEDDLGNAITDFEFSEDGYQFLYSDAPSGGETGNKIFAESISYGEFTVDLQVSVCRNEHAEAQGVVDTMTGSWTGVPGTSYTEWNSKVGNSGAVYAGNSMAPTGNSKGAGGIQLRSNNNNSGIVATLYSGTAYLSSVSVVWHSDTENGRTLNIYGKHSPYEAATDLYNDNTKGTLLGTIVKGTSTSLVIEGDYKYIGIRSNSGALYLNKIEITYSLADSAENVANYIMFEDTENQCLSKYDEAKELFLALPAEMRSTFMTSSDYVIATARERLQAWAAHEGETIIFVNGDYAMSTSGLFVSSMKKEQGDSTLLIILVALLGVGLGGAYLILRRRSSN